MANIKSNNLEAAARRTATRHGLKLSKSRRDQTYSLVDVRSNFLVVEGSTLAEVTQYLPEHPSNSQYVPAEVRNRR